MIRGRFFIRGGRAHNDIEVRVHRNITKCQCGRRSKRSNVLIDFHLGVWDRDLMRLVGRVTIR